jgi:hypothetical protein
MKVNTLRAIGPRSIVPACLNNTSTVRISLLSIRGLHQQRSACYVLFRRERSCTRLMTRHDGTGLTVVELLTCESTIAGQKTATSTSTRTTRSS